MMVKFGIKDGDGSYLLGLGLSDRNIELLKKGMPIGIDLSSVAPGFDLSNKVNRVLIVWGETEVKIIEDLKAMGEVIVPPLPSEFD